MQVNDLPGQGKADAGFSAPPHVEAIKDVGKIFLGDAVPVVLYPDGHVPLVRAAGQAQLAAGIAHAVGQDIGDRSAQPGNPILRLKDDDNASVDCLVSTEIITSDMIE